MKNLMFLICCSALGLVPNQVASQARPELATTVEDPVRLLTLTITGKRVRIPRGYLLSSQVGKQRVFERVKDGDILDGSSFELCWPELGHPNPLA